MQAVFLLIGKTSALTMNIAGVVKDWLLIGLSYVMYRWAREVPKRRAGILEVSGLYSYTCTGTICAQALSKVCHAKASSCGPAIRTNVQPLSSYSSHAVHILCRAPVTGLNLAGYSVAFGAVCW